MMVFYVHVSSKWCSFRSAPKSHTGHWEWKNGTEKTLCEKFGIDHQRLPTKAKNFCQTLRSTWFWNADLTLSPWTSKLSLSGRNRLKFQGSVTLRGAPPRLSRFLFTVGRGRHAWLWSQASQAASSTSRLPSLLCRPHCHHCPAEDAAMGASPPPEPPPPAGVEQAGAGQLGRQHHQMSRREGFWGGQGLGRQGESEDDSGSNRGESHGRG